MNAEGELFPPAQYDIVWILVLTGLIVMLVIFYLFVFLSTRRIKPEEEIKPLPRVANGVERLSLIKNKYSQKVTQIQSSYTSGSISNRKAFQLLSISLRNFTHEYSGSGAHAMSLTDLQQNNAPEVLLEKIRNFYPTAFEEAERQANVELAVEDVLKVIQIWH